VASLDLRVSSVRRATPGARIIRLDLEGASFDYRAGQVATLGLPGGERVPYSIASAPVESARSGHLEFLTRFDPDSHLRDVRRGSRLVVDGPFGSFTFPPDRPERHFLFVAGGTGVAPLRSMIVQGIVTDQPGIRHLLYSARTPEHFAYLTELRRLAREGRLELALTATRQTPPRWRGDRGRITRERLARLLHDPATLCFVCGPAAMVDEVPRMLMELGIERGRIRIEEW
jgi:NAD(P)H-flavin reductase